MMSKRAFPLAVLLAVTMVSPTSAQLLGGPLGGVTQPVTDTVGQVGNTVGNAIGDPAPGGITGLAGNRSYSQGPRIS